MIFVTVGSHQPFDRLIRTVDEWCEQQPDGTEVFAQIGHTTYRPANMEWSESLDPDEYAEKLNAADQVIAHAGIGTILKALELAKPLVVMPRRPELRETENDQQLAAAHRFRELGSICVTFDEAELKDVLDGDGMNAPVRPIGRFAESSLVETLRRFIAGDKFF